VSDGIGIAVVGMAGRFPGAPDIERLWTVLRSARRTISDFEEPPNAAPGSSGHYVASRGLIAGADRFDAAFFGMSPHEAAVTDPQHRLLLECAWHALEDSGHDPGTFDGVIGAYGGVGMNTYLLELASDPEAMASAGDMLTMIGNDKDYALTRVAYKLDLRGPCVTVQTACSTSLVAVHLACLGLISGDCDMALAGGASVSAKAGGYRFMPGGLFSPDGHCRPFDAHAAGTVPGHGTGIVVLRRLEDAVADGDSIRAVIRGTAINNDGALKAGFTGPSAHGQAAAIAAALEVAEVDARTIGYVEAHGTATELGDPIEVAGLSRAFASFTDHRQFCLLGSVKANLGHLDAAAGVTGLIKAVLCVERGEIPPMPGFRRPSPRIDFLDTPFRIAQESTLWRDGTASRRAGVSSFGIGGTNAHVVLEQAAPRRRRGRRRDDQVLIASAKTAEGADTAAARLGEALSEATVDLADVAHTLQSGRRAFQHRRGVVLPAANAGATLGGDRWSMPFHGVADDAHPPEVAFGFPGAGVEYPGMAADVYSTETVFRETLDRCLGCLATDIAEEVASYLLATGVERSAARDSELRPRVGHVAVFASSYALAELWRSWGVTPSAVLGHSLGEYVAAAVAGVFEPEDALRLVADRAGLMEDLPPGAMLTVALSEEQVRETCPDSIDIASVNAPDACVVSGSVAGISELQRTWETSGVACRRVRFVRAAHSRSVEPALAALGERVRQTDRRAPAIPMLSNVTGTWLSAEEAVRPGYWTAHMRRTVRLHDELTTLFEHPQAILLEVGWGRSLTTYAQRLPAARQRAVSAFDRRDSTQRQTHALLQALAQLWCAGVAVDWPAFGKAEDRHRVPLPLYPFQRSRHWLLRDQPDAAAADESAAPEVAPHAPSPEPGGALGAAMAAWRAVLGIETAGADTDFFSAGGDSLLAIQAAARLSAALGVPVEPRDIAEHPTPAMIAARAETSPIAAPTAGVPALVRLRRGAGDGAIVCVHPVGGRVGCYAELVRCLTVDADVLGIEAVGLDGSPPLGSVPEMASLYLETVARARPETPCSLLGWSFGAVVAAEMARLLEARGTPVERLVLLDPPPLGDREDQDDDETWLEAIAEDVLRAAPDQACQRRPAIGRRDRRQAVRSLLPDVDVDALVGVFRANFKALSVHVPRPVTSTPAMLVTSQDTRLADPSNEERWAALLDGPHVISRACGDHWAMVRRPVADAVARWLAETSASADNAGEGSVSPKRP
jgi:acyl transferase domain-containing protein/thioesterase domain-containing protein